MTGERITTDEPVVPAIPAVEAPMVDAGGPPPGEVFPPPSAPLAVARRLVEVDDLTQDGTLTVHWWRGGFYFWTGTHWVEVADPAVRARLYRALEHACYLKPRRVRKPSKQDQSEGDGEEQDHGEDEDQDEGGEQVVVVLEPVPWAPTRRKIGDLLEALQAVVHLDEQIDPPEWIEGDDDGSRLAVANGLLDLTTRELIGHTPRLFNLLALPYGYVPDATSPEHISRWLEFLAALWPDDPDSIKLLQEWFGYVLSGETNLHKILLTVGPPRSGKGTIARVLTALVGKANTAGPTLASLGTNFGLSPLLAKTLAVVSDARLGGSDPFTVVERLLSISGEDALTVDRKYRQPWTGRLPTRFAIFTNELPNLGDASGAVASRFLVLTLTKSWLGNEDPTLTDDLLAELPGILVWALDGLDRLRKQGRFTEPATSRDAVIALAELTSPVGAFVREACNRGAGHQVLVRDLYQAWRQWSQDHGRDRPTTEQVFGRDLRAAVPGLRVTRPWDDGSGPRPRHYEGIDLTEAYKQYIAADRGLTRTAPGDEPPVHNSPRSGSMYTCQGCGQQTTAFTTMTGNLHPECGGRWQAAGQAAS